MPHLSLRALTLRLAAERADLRPLLVRVIEGQGKPLTAQEQARLPTRGAGNTSVIQQPPIIIQLPPITVQQEAPAQAPPVMLFQPYPAMPMTPAMPVAPVPPAVAPPAVTPTQVPVAPSPAAVGALFVTERTQRGFEADLLPEMERLLASGQSVDQVANHILGLIRQAFTEKNHLYNILIRHQATFEGDADYRAGLERLVQAWVADTVEPGG